MPMPENVSRAAMLHLIAGQLALDFANTASGRGSPTHQEHLREPLNVVEWAHHARIVSAGEARRLRASKLKPSLLTDATRLRNLIYEIGSSIAMGAKLKALHLSELSSQHAVMLASAKLRPAGRHLRWTWADAPSSLLGPISEAAVELLTRLEPSRIKQCSGHQCGWLFYDETKNNSRRWCDMKVCGNRSKARNARKRKAAK
jgi:predicted RNA-binding Zn ribbon-like protein